MGLLVIFPFLTLFAMVVNYISIGPVFYVAAGGATFQALFNFVFGIFYGYLQNKFLRAKDTRMRYLDEMMQGI
jgi:hypothetical protein